MRRSRSQVEIFNFSFLDILACTIGLLIFIMVMVFVLQSGSTVMADYSKIVVKDDDRAESLRKQADADEAIASRLEGETERMASLVDKELVARRLAAKSGRDAAAADFDKSRKALADLQASVADKIQTKEDLRKKLSQADKALADAQRRHAAAAQRQAALMAESSSSNILVRASKAGDPGADSNILHVDCQKERVVVMKLPLQGKPQLLATTNSRDLELFTSDYMKQIEAHAQATKPVVVFWVRPDGIDTFVKAKSMLPSGLDYGYEPAAADWSFGTTP